MTALMNDGGSALTLAPSWGFEKLATFEAVSLTEANQMLEAWGHKMGPLARGNQSAWCHALTHQGQPVAVTTASFLISPVVGNAHWLTRENTVELSRLCAVRSGLCRVALRMWREFVFPALPFGTAVSYQDADLHNGHTYRCDGWERVARSRSGVDTRSGRQGRDKWVWQYPPRISLLKVTHQTGTENLK
jgi:hypothetical protein